jgi:hypothetical protein
MDAPRIGKDIDQANDIDQAIDKGIEKGMRVIAIDDRRIGFVLGLEGHDMLRITTEPARGVGYDHLVPLAWVNDVKDCVFLDKPAAYIAINWRSALQRRDLRVSRSKLGATDPQIARAATGSPCRGRPKPRAR